MRRYIAALLVLVCAFAAAQHNLIPRPRVLADKAPGRVSPSQVVTRPLPEGSPAEMYEIEIGPERIEVRCATPQGEVWARRTLDQLRDSAGTYPQVSIADWPEFPIRAFMYDSGRNFVEVSQIKEFIDLCSQYKLNAFHWHLTDKPAWRIESRVHPELNDARCQRIGRDAGRYYTYDDIRNVITYARERGVVVIPEIDMPGHSDYFTATYGTRMNTPRGMEILTECLAEFFDEFPAEDMPYMHIGSDEVSIDNPRQFMDWAVKTVEDAGRTPLVWDPGLDAGPRAICQVWRDGLCDPAEMPQGKRIVDSYMGYLNYVDPIMFNARMFLHPVCSTGQADPTRLGGILCLWNDVRVIDKTRLPLHSGMMGGVLPFAERAWLGGGPRRPMSDVLRHPEDPDMQDLMEFQQRMAWHKAHRLPDLLGYWQPNDPRVEWDLELRDSLGSVVHSGKAYGSMIDFGAIARQAGVDHAAVEGVITRKVHADCDTALWCRIGFDAPARSDRLGDGVPLQGQWENYGKVTVNGQEVMPPVWLEPGLYRYHYHTWARPEEEQPYTDEQLYWMRERVRVPLQKGENVIEMSTRRHYDQQHFQAAMLADGQ